MSEEDIPDIKCSSQIFNLDFHPSQNVVALGLISGEVELYRYGTQKHEKIVSLRIHEDAVRSCGFTSDGQCLISGSSDKSIKCINAAGSEMWNIANAHDSAVNIVLPFSEGLLVSGDDDGTIKLWDSRQQKPISTIDVNEDVITDFLVDIDRSTLLATSCDGTMDVIDIKKMKLVDETPQEEDELLSIGIVKNGMKVVAGTQDGVLLIWDWGKWKFEDPNDAQTGPVRFRGHPESIDSILSVDEDTLITGSSDGILRVVTIAPNKLVGIVGEHSDFPIEKLCWSNDKKIIGSISHDSIVKFWDVSYFYDEDEDEDDEDFDNNGTSKFSKMPAISLPTRSSGDDEDEDEDEDEDSLIDDEDDSDSLMDDDDMDEEEEVVKKVQKPKKNKNSKKGFLPVSQSKRRGSSKKAATGSDFFSGL